MKRVFLGMVVTAMLVSWGLAQTPNASGNMDPANVKGCLGGSESKTTGAADHSLAVTELSMISEHRAAVAGAPAATVDPAPQTVIPLDPTPAAPAPATAPAPDAAAPCICADR
jgi:hypothetical protein